MSKQKNLTELYGAGMEQNPSITDVMFKAAYPEDAEHQSAIMRRLSGELTGPFMEKWTERLTEAFTPLVQKGDGPEAIMKEVPWLTKDEAIELLGIIDQYIVGDTQEISALRIVDLGYYLPMLKEQAQQMLYSIAMNNRRILTPSSAKGLSDEAIATMGQIILP